MMYKTYKTLTFLSMPLLLLILKRRLKIRKETPRSLLEKQAISSKTRPTGQIIWFHAASVGEAQSTLVLIKRFMIINPQLNILVTTGTITSAQIMDERLPKQAFHQFYPLDNPIWVRKFIEYWNPSCVIWMESELWPNMLHEIKIRNIPAMLVNAHISKKSFLSWSRIKSLAKITLSTFNKILCQTDKDKERFTILGAENITVTHNLKYSACALDYDEEQLEALSTAMANRPIWLYSSTHKGEEEIACEIHLNLKKQFPDLLTIIVPRHPERRYEIKEACEKFNLNIKFRGNEKQILEMNDDIYIADTLGELGLFYRLSPIACIGRSFSDDGGGGHNPIEAAQLGCGVLHGSNIQNLQDIFDDMNNANAALCMNNVQELETTLATLLSDNNKMTELQNNGKLYSKSKIDIVENIMSEIIDILGDKDIFNAN